MGLLIDTGDYREKIKQNILDRLRLITTVNGYSLSVNYVSDQVKHWEELEVSQFPSLMVTSGDGEFPYGTISRVNCYMLPIIVGYVKSEEYADTQLNALIRAVRKCLLLTNKSQATYAIQTWIERVTTDKGTLRPFGVFELNMRIEYRETDIY